MSTGPQGGIVGGQCEEALGTREPDLSFEGRKT